MGAKNVPFLVTHDGRTIRYPDPNIKTNDTIQLDIATSKITDHIKFESGMFLLWKRFVRTRVAIERCISENITNMTYLTLLCKVITASNYSLI